MPEQFTVAAHLEMAAVYRQAEADGGAFVAAGSCKLTAEHLEHAAAVQRIVDQFLAAHGDYPTPIREEIQAWFRGELSAYLQQKPPTT